MKGSHWELTRSFLEKPHRRGGGLPRSAQRGRAQSTGLQGRDPTPVARDGRGKQICVDMTCIDHTIIGSSLAGQRLA